MCEDELRCNVRRCRARLSGFAWVTACSHVFCDPHGSGQLGRSPALCPACSTALAGGLDIVRTHLSPSERHKAMVLAGLRPQLVLDIAARALAFWTYQIHQERMYQEFAYNKAEGQMRQMEKMYTQQLQAKDMEVSGSRSEVSSLKKLLEEYKKKYSDMSEKLMERNRQYQRLQGLYDSLRLHSIALAGEGEPAGASGGVCSLPTGSLNQFVPGDPPGRRPSGDGDFCLRPSFFSSPAPEGSSSFFSFSPGDERERPPLGEPSCSFKMKRM
ncbi:E3 ubiquitin-protein ligase CCNB1IP1 [Pristis pectinata]|uniref:E3 ubiquitin-protein ligase CCNB1IP1 n=1 Tax=Pristis pectinata TaxID=685728 RepID=UPI00223D72B3|nr:E3 ubiquitin-protein ligase CCNB1IP1 [Pristis pectinata]